MEDYEDQIEGRNSVLEFLKSGKDVNRIFIQKGEKHGSINEIYSIAKKRRIIIDEGDKSVIVKKAKTSSPQGVIAIVPPCDYSTIDDILNQNNIPRFSFREAAGKRIKISKGDFEKEFNSVKDCAEWFVENQICKTKNAESARAGLKKARSAKGNGLYYGYLIENI